MRRIIVLALALAACGRRPQDVRIVARIDASYDSLTGANGGWRIALTATDGTRCIMRTVVLPNIKTGSLVNCDWRMPGS
jgi:phosphosulfolactate phosphohydrolase-like enzyme